MSKARNYVILILFLLLFILFFYWRAQKIYFAICPPDEVQYCLLAENIFDQYKVAIRGSFPSLIPPLYSFVLFLFKKIFFLDFPNYWKLVNSILFATALIPTYFLLKNIGFSEKFSLALGILLINLPYNIYIASCMSENLYFLIFMSFSYVVMLFLNSPNVFKSVVVGVIAGLAILTKVSGFLLLLLFMLFSLFYFRANKKFLSYSFFSIFVSFLVYCPWIFLKYLALKGSSSVIGRSYYESLSLSIKRFWSMDFLQILAVYVSDMFFASGIIVFSPLLFSLFFGKLDRRILFFYVAAFATIFLASFYSGLLSGYIRERHMFLAVPSLVISYFYILRYSSLCERERFCNIALIGWTISIFSLASIVLYEFGVFKNFPFESPWLEFFIFIYKSLGISVEVFMRHFFFFLLPFVVVTSFFFFVPVKTRIYFSWMWLFFYFFSSANLSYYSFYQWGLSDILKMQYHIISVITNKIKTRSTLLFFGSPYYFESRRMCSEQNDLISKQIFGLTKEFILKLELKGLYEIRMICNIRNLTDFLGQDNTYLFSILEIKGLRKIFEYGPYKIYSLKKGFSSDLKIEIPHLIKVPVDFFFTQAGQRKYIDNDHLYYIMSQKNGWIAYGPYWKLPLGKYKVEFLIECDEPSDVILDVNEKNVGVLAKKRIFCQNQLNPILTFDVKQDSLFEFRVFLRKGSLKFKGVNLYLLKLSHDAGLSSH